MAETTAPPHFARGDRRPPLARRCFKSAAVEAAIAAVHALTEGHGADYAFEATGVAALAFLPLKLCRYGGNAVQLSGAHGPVSIEMPQFWWDKSYLVPLYGGCLPQRDFPRLLGWAERGQLALDDMLAGRGVKGVILLGGES